MKSLADMDDTDVVAHVRQRIRDFERFASDWRSEARDSFEFASGRQWSPEDESYLKEQNRPPVTFNRVGKFIDAVVGTETNNKMEWKYSVSGVQSTAAVDLTTQVVRQLTAENVEGETTLAFRDMLICGYGWTDTRMDYVESMEGRLTEEHVDPFYVAWDPKANQRNLTDARWVARVKDYSEQELEEEWEGSTGKIAEGGDILIDSEAGPSALMDRGEYDFSGMGEDDDAIDRPSKYRVICYQEMSVKDVIVTTNPLNGGVETLEPEKFVEVQRRLMGLGQTVQSFARAKKRVWNIAYVCGPVLLAPVEEIPCRTLEPMTGKWDRNKRYYYGMVRAARDPQLWENKFRSNIMHAISSAGKGVMVEEDAIAQNDWRKFENDWSRPDRIKRLAAGAISQGKIKAPDPVPLPAGLAELMASSAAAVPDVLGLSPEFLGLAGRTQSGVVERSRRQAGLAVISEYFQSRREHIKRTGRIKLAFVLAYIPDWVFVRIGGEQATQVLPQLRRADFAQYEIKVDEAPVSPDQKAEVWQDILQIAPALIPMGLPPQFWVAALKYSPWPASLVSQLEQAISQPNPVADHQAQLDLRQKAADVAETESKVLLNQAKAQEAATPDVSNVLSARAQAEKSALEMDFKRKEHGMKMNELAATTQAQVIKALADVNKAQQQAELATERQATNAG